MSDKELKAAEEFLHVALGGKMNISTLKPLAWHEIMVAFARDQNGELSSTKEEVERLREASEKMTAALIKNKHSAEKGKRKQLKHHCDASVACEAIIKRTDDCFKALSQGKDGDHE